MRAAAIWDLPPFFTHTNRTAGRSVVIVSGSSCGVIGWGRWCRPGRPSAWTSRRTSRRWTTRPRKVGCMADPAAVATTNEVAPYARASMQRKRARWTVDPQLRKIRALAEAKDSTVVEVYEDNAV